MNLQIIQIPQKRKIIFIINAVQIIIMETLISLSYHYNNHEFHYHLFKSLQKNLYLMMTCIGILFQVFCHFYANFYFLLLFNFFSFAHHQSQWNNLNFSPLGIFKFSLHVYQIDSSIHTPTSPVKQPLFYPPCHSAVPHAWPSRDEIRQINVSLFIW